MPCTSLTSLLKSCDSNIGGLKSISVYDFDGTLTGGTQYTGTSITIEFAKESGSLSQTETLDLASGAISTQQTLSVTVPRRDATKLNAIKIMAQGQRDLMIKITDSNSYVAYMGLGKGANLTTAASTTGSKSSDGNNYTLTFVANEGDLI